MALDPRQRTDCLYSTLTTAYNRLRPELEPSEDRVLSEAIHSAICSDRVNLDRWLDELTLPDPHKDQIEGLLSQRLPDREFEIDTTHARKLIRKRRFRGDHGLSVEVSADAYDQVVRSVDYVEEPGAQPYYRVVIQTDKWREVPR